MPYMPLSIRGFVLLLPMLGLAPASAQTDGGDWQKHCGGVEVFNDKCFISQGLRLRDSGRKLFEIAAGYPLEGDFPMLLLTGPLGMYLPDGIRIQVDDTEGYRAVVAFCDVDGCHAYYRMTERLYRMFRQGRWLRVALNDGTRREIRFEVSLNGFTAGIESLR